MVELVNEKLKPNSVEQYRKEVRSAIAKRVLTSNQRYKDLIEIMKMDNISTPDKIEELSTSLQKLTYNSQFKRCKSMGEILETGINFIIKNYQHSQIKNREAL